MGLLQDTLNNSKLYIPPNPILWLDLLKKAKPSVIKLAFWISCFEYLMGKVHDAMLRAYLVPVLTQKDFSVNWLVSNSVEFIQSQLNALGKKPEFSRIMKDVAVCIQDDNHYQVLDTLDDLLSIPGIKSCSASLMLQYAFNQLKLRVFSSCFNVINPNTKSFLLFAEWKIIKP